MIVYVIQEIGGNNNSPNSLNIIVNYHYHGENRITTRYLPSMIILEDKDKDRSYVEDEDNERSSESPTEEYRYKKSSYVEDKGNKHPSETPTVKEEVKNVLGQKGKI